MSQAVLSQDEVDAILQGITGESQKLDVDTDRVAADGTEAAYDRLLLATGRIEFYMGANMIQAFTAVEQNVPTTALDLALWMESDRMGHFAGAISEDLLDEQRGVVQNEKRQLPHLLNLVDRCPTAKSFWCWLDLCQVCSCRLWIRAWSVRQCEPSPTT